MTDLATLTARALAAEGKAAAAREQAEDEQRRHLEAQEARERAWDETALAAYDDDDDALAAEEKAALAALREAVLADPVYGSWLRYRTARQRRWLRQSEAGSIINRWNLPPRPFPMVGRGSEDLSAVVAEIVTREAMVAAAEEADARAEERSRVPGVNGTGEAS